MVSPEQVCAKPKYLKRATLGDSVRAREVVPSHQTALGIDLYLACGLDCLLQREVGVARGCAKVRGHDGDAQKALVWHLDKRVCALTQGLLLPEACSGQEPWWLRPVGSPRDAGVNYAGLLVDDDAVAARFAKLDRLPGPSFREDDGRNAPRRAERGLLDRFGLCRRWFRVGMLCAIAARRDMRWRRNDGQFCVATVGNAKVGAGRVFIFANEARMSSVRRRAMGTATWGIDDARLHHGVFGISANG